MFSMLLDERVLGLNATLASQQEWAAETLPQVKLLWVFMILLNLASLLHIDPLVLHFVSVVLKKIPDAVISSTEQCAGLFCPEG